MMKTATDYLLAQGYSISVHLRRGSTADTLVGEWLKPDGETSLGGRVYFSSHDLTIGGQLAEMEPVAITIVQDLHRSQQRKAAGLLREAETTGTLLRHWGHEVTSY